jgi:orotate phosphoribosyltransferase
LKLPFVYVRNKAKEHGRQNQIEGHISAGDRALVVEDLISTGGSSLKVVESLRSAGVEVVGLLAIFSYNFDKAAEAFRKAGCRAESLSNYDILIREALASKFINLNDVDLLTTWRKINGQ